MEKASVMVRVAFSQYGISRISLLHGNEKAEDYFNVLEHHLNPLMNVHVQKVRDVLVDQDNESMHTARLTHGWLRFIYILLMDCPARSLDLNPI